MGILCIHANSEVPIRFWPFSTNIQRKGHSSHFDKKKGMLAILAEKRGNLIKGRIINITTIIRATINIASRIPILNSSYWYSLTWKVCEDVIMSSTMP